MSLFREAGKRFEETKQVFLGETESDYVCGSCDEPVAGDYEYCPHCGEESVEPAE